MKRASKRFWQLVSILAILAFALPTGKGSKKVEEDTLAGLRPGKDSIQRAYQRFGKESIGESPLGGPGVVDVQDFCTHQELFLTLDSSGLIQEVAVGHELADTDADCTPHSYSREVRAKFGSGRGLLFRDRCERIQEIYGQPESKNSSANGNEQLESYVYRNDEAGKGVPLTLGVTCNVTENYVDGIKLTVSRPSPKS